MERRVIYSNVNVQPIQFQWQHQCLSQDLETGCLKLAVVKFWGVHIFKGDPNILIFQPKTCINSSK